MPAGRQPLLLTGFDLVDDLSALADGLFPLAAWAVVLVGVGAFHVVDQVVLHLLLEAHHVRMVEDDQLYDGDCTAIGVLLVLIGRRLVRAA